MNLLIFLSLYNLIIFCFPQTTAGPVCSTLIGQPLTDYSNTLNNMWKQIIFPDIVFPCRGNVIGWQYRERQTQQGFSFTLQVWRLQNNVATLVGHTDIQPDSYANSGLLSQTLNLSCSQTISVLSGDILGIYFPNEAKRSSIPLQSFEVPNEGSSFYAYNLLSSINMPTSLQLSQANENEDWIRASFQAITDYNPTRCDLSMPPNIITSIIESSRQLGTNQVMSSSLHQINKSPSQIKLTSSSVHMTKMSISSSSLITRSTSQPNSNAVIITQSLSSQILTTRSSVVSVTRKTSLTSSAILEDPTLFFSGGSRNEGQLTVTIICIAIVVAVVILSLSLLGMAVLIRCKRHKKVRRHEKEITSCNANTISYSNEMLSGPLGSRKTSREKEQPTVNVNIKNYITTCGSDNVKSETVTKKENAINISTENSRKQNYIDIQPPDPEMVQKWLSQRHQVEEDESEEKEEELAYWKPAANINQLYYQLSDHSFLQIKSQDLRLGEELGHGYFGFVKAGKWLVNDRSVKTAVKMLKESASKEDKVKFLQEAAIMGQFDHPNIVKLYGVVIDSDPVMIVLELMPNFDLHSHLCTLRNKLGANIASIVKWRQQFLQYSINIVDGMVYLSNRKFVHRDLAARNIFIDNCLTCKIGDFGMARDISLNDYYVMKNTGPLPLKWTAPEALGDKKYTTASDVWSYGMVLYEIWSLGNKPFEELGPIEAIQAISSGEHPIPPSCCTQDLMLKCWTFDPNQRPSFRTIQRSLLNMTTIKPTRLDRDYAILDPSAVLRSQRSSVSTVYHDVVF